MLRERSAKGDDCVLSLDRMCLFVRRKTFFHTCENADSAEHPPVCLRSRSDFTPRSPPVEAREEGEEERGVVGEREVVAEPLTRR